MQPEPPIISTRVFSGFEPFLAGKGVEFGPLLQAAGIKAQALEDPNGELKLVQVASLFELAAEEANDPCLGLHWAEAYPQGATGVLGYSVLNAGTLREAMQAVARYMNLVVHPSRLTYAEDSDQGTLSWHLSSLAATSTTQYVSFSCAAIVLRLRAVVGTSWSPLTVDLAHRELPCLETLHQIFGTRVTFNAAITSITADRKSLDLKALHRDPRLFELMNLLGERLLAERASATDIVSQCQEAIVDILNHGDVTLDAVAERLGLAPRTLQSKLASAETTFDNILQETRKDLAIGYLRESDLPLTDIALMLGFSELSAFSRATQRWFGMPPRVYRQELRRTGSRAAAGP